MIARRRRTASIVLGVLLLFIGVTVTTVQEHKNTQRDTTAAPPLVVSEQTGSAYQVLAELAVKGRAPKTGYEREQFGAGWADVDSCDMRNYILQRDMENEQLDPKDDCTVLSGNLHDPYTDKAINFTRGTSTSQAVQIDHVVALSDAWQKGAQQSDVGVRAEFANDPLNLLAVDGPTNSKKSDGDAATWLPPNESYRCSYVARQVAVKQKYNLWVTAAERDAMVRVLETCPAQSLPSH